MTDWLSLALILAGTVIGFRLMNLFFPTEDPVTTRRTEIPMSRPDVATKIVLEITLPALPIAEALEKANEILDDIDGSDGMPKGARLVGDGIDIALTDV